MRMQQKISCVSASAKMCAIINKLWKVLMHPRVYMTVEPIIFVFMFAQFLSYSTFQQLVRSMVCDRNPNCTTTSSNQSQSLTCSALPDAVEDEVQKEASHWLLYVNTAMGIPSILFSLIYGSFSDQLGRKPFMFLPALGAAMNTGLILEVVYLDGQLPMYLFLIGALVAGLYGSYSIFNSAAYSYTSDVTAQSGRTRQIGVVEAMTYLGATLSLLIGGIWISKDSSFISPFWCVLSCQLAVMLYVLVALPESMYFLRHTPDENRPVSTYNRKFSQSHKFTRACSRFFGAVRSNMFGFFKLVLTDWRVAVLMVTFFVVEINFLGITDVVILYSLGKPLCWNSKIIGYFLALKVFLNGLASLVVLPIMLALNWSDAVITLIGLVMGGASLVMMGLATSTWIMFIGK